jgi:hypothetical protein
LYDIDFPDQAVKMSFKMLQKIIKRWQAERIAGRSPLEDGLGFTIRFAYPDDEDALRHLAALDSQPVPPGPLLVAEVAGEVWAAVSLAGEPRSIADPFHHTAELIALLRDRADRLTREGRNHAAQQPAMTAAYS